MARDLTSSARYEALSPRAQNAYSRVLDAIDLMAEHPEWSRTRAARLARVDPRTIDRYASSAFETHGRRRELRPNDWLYRSETMPVYVRRGDPARPEGGVVDLSPRTRRQRSALGSYWNDVQQVLKGHDVDLARRYGGLRIAGHPVETDRRRIREGYAAGLLHVVVEISPRV